jgi:hypothetical protein
VIAVLEAKAKFVAPVLVDLEDDGSLVVLLLVLPRSHG